MLRNEGFQDLRLHHACPPQGVARIRGSIGDLVDCTHDHGVFDMRGKIRSISKMTTAANHRQIDASPTTLHFGHQDIDISISCCINSC
jgi:hypothetical protein